MPSGIPLSDRRNFRENRPLLVSAELARPSITQQMGSEFHPARVTTINARLPVSKPSRAVCRKLARRPRSGTINPHIATALYSNRNILWFCAWQPTFTRRTIALALFGPWDRTSQRWLHMQFPKVRAQSPH